MQLPGYHSDSDKILESGCHGNISAIKVIYGKNTQVIPNPALAYPAMVLSSVSPLADAESTSISLVRAVTGMLSPVREPFSSVPMDITPVREGVRLSSVPALGVNTLFGVADWYICAVTVTVEPTRERAAVVLKNALKEVIVPARGV